MPAGAAVSPRAPRPAVEPHPTSHIRSLAGASCCGRWPSGARADRHRPARDAGTGAGRVRASRASNWRWMLRATTISPTSALSSVADAWPSSTPAARCASGAHCATPSNSARRGRSAMSSIPTCTSIMCSVMPRSAQDRPSFVGHWALAAAIARSREFFLQHYADDLDQPADAARDHRPGPGGTTHPGSRPGWPASAPAGMADRAYRLRSDGAR
jgi:hypothetical protein